MPETMTLADSLKALAEATVDTCNPRELCCAHGYSSCSAPFMLTGKPCHCCIGVTRFPMLRKPCKALGSYKFSRSDGTHDDACTFCSSGNGWLPLHEAEATIELALAAARSQMWRLCLDQGGREAIAFVTGSDGSGYKIQRGQLGQEREMVYQALLAALRASEKEPL